MAEDTGPTLPYTRATRNGFSTTAPAGMTLAIERQKGHVA